MATPTFLLGRNAKAYYSATNKLIGDVTPAEGKTGIADYVEAWLGDAGTALADNMTDVGLNVGSDFADATTRATAASGFASQVPVLRNGEVTFEARWIPDDPAATVTSFTKQLIDAWEGDSRLAMVFLDQAYVRPALPADNFVLQGFASNWSVSLEKSENLRDVQRISVTLTVADTAVWYRETMAPAGGGG